MPTSPKSKNQNLLNYENISTYPWYLPIMLPLRQASCSPECDLRPCGRFEIGDLSPTNPDCKIKTPHLQKMADEGINFMDAHSSSAVCTPTRYGVLTGRYNWRSRLARGVLSGTSEHLIPETCHCRPLTQEGRIPTQMIGKWHLGWDWAKADKSEKKWKDIGATKPVKNGPDINGFVNYYGHCGSSTCLPMFGWIPEK